ncbi:MAG: lipopolysaccharide heptosyltransferase II [Acidobacteriota bacterium]
MADHRILVRATNWIGDCVMSLPALREIRQLFPDHRLTLLARPWVAGLYKGQCLVDEILLLEEGQSSFRRVREMRHKLRVFEGAVLFQNAFEAALMVYLARIPERIGYSTEGRGLFLTRHAHPRIKDSHRHQVFYYLDLLYQTRLSPVDYLNCRTFRPDIRLNPTEEGLAQAKTLLEQNNVDSSRPLVGLNPGAYYGPTKRWFTDRYASLADRLVRDQDANVIIIGHSGELKIAEEIQANMRFSPAILSGQTDLSTLIALISLCRLFISNDSGPMHLAAALSVPQIALFGSTDDRATGPFDPRSVVIHKHVECSPCLLRECPIDLRCFSRIEVEEVYETACRLLSGCRL